MKKQWKIGMFTSLLALAFVGTMHITADASAIAEDDVVIDYVYETMTVNTEYDEVIYYTDNYHTDLSRWDFCEVRDVDGDGDREAVFDISWVSEDKTVRIYLCGDEQTDVVSINLTWQEDFGVKFVGTLLETDITEAQAWKDTYARYPKFSEDTGYFIFTVEENKRDNYYYDLDTIQWRKGSDGAWREFRELDLKEMNIRGIKLEFRIKAHNEQDTTGGVSAASVLTDAGTRASSVAKVTVAKLADSPEVLVTPDIMTVDVRNGEEFSVDKENWILIPMYSKKLGTKDYLVSEATREKAISPIYTNQRITGLLIQEVLGINARTEMTREVLEEKGFDFDEDGNVIVYVREAGTQKKAASLIEEVLIPLSADGLSVAKKADLNIYQADSKTGTGGIVCENVSNQNKDYATTYPEGVKYQVAILTPEEYAQYEEANALENIDVSKLKWTSVKPGRMLKLANKKVEEGSYLLYRIAGENGKLPSTYLISNKIRYDLITYIGFASSSSKKVGDTLDVVISTNVAPDTVTYKWERFTPQNKNEEVDEDSIVGNVEGWKVIEGVTGPTYELKAIDEGCYIRVTATSTKENDAENTRTSDIIGPIKPSTNK